MSRQSYKVTITDKVRPDADVIFLQAGNSRRFRFQRSMGRKDVDNVLTHEVSMSPGRAMGLARDGYKISPDPLKEQREAAEARMAEKTKKTTTKKS